jgi:mannobiose 2-epimerase
MAEENISSKNAGSCSVCAEELIRNLKDGILRRWYPLVIDGECGGYYTNVSYDWKLLPEQEKMIVSQARHIWTLSKAAEFFGGVKEYEDAARHGFLFLKKKMWDETFGGFFQIRSRNGGMSDVRGWKDEKRIYGNAYGVFALASLYEYMRDPEVLKFAQTALHWIEEHAYDPVHKGYFQFLTREAKPFDRSSAHTTIAFDANEVGFKDQNSSIHLMEAFTELYGIWKDPLVRTRLQSILELIRDTIVTRRGYLQLFFHPDWTPVSFRGSSKEEREANYCLDHVSFGHDYETAFLMLEASYALGLSEDTKTLAVAKNMLDHAIRYGWDEETGGFCDEGYYFAGDEHCTIIKDTKNWWAQAEGMNALLLFSRIFPNERKYQECFVRQWEYIKSSVIDAENGDWFEGGIDKEPHYRTGRKSHVWKCTYHTSRALMNCITMLQDKPDSGMKNLIEHWRKTAELLPA